MLGSGEGFKDALRSRKENVASRGMNRLIASNPRETCRKVTWPARSNANDGGLTSAVVCRATRKGRGGQPAATSANNCALPPEAVVSMQTCRSNSTRPASGASVTNGRIGPRRAASAMA